MKNKPKDRALDIPAEANRDKHINYLEEAEKAAGIEGKDSNEFRKRMGTITSDDQKSTGKGNKNS